MQNNRISGAIEICALDNGGFEVFRIVEGVRTGRYFTRDLTQQRKDDWTKRVHEIATAPSAGVEITVPPVPALQPTQEMLLDSARVEAETIGLYYSDLFHKFQLNCKEREDLLLCCDQYLKAVADCSATNVKLRNRIDGLVMKRDQLYSHRLILMHRDKVLFTIN